MATNFPQRMLRLRSKIALTTRSSVRIAKLARLCSRKRASSMHFFHRIAQGAQDAHALSQGISQGAQHDQRVSALLVVGFGMPLSATRIAGAGAGGERLCANSGSIS